jgi:hypothetical protein
MHIVLNHVRDESGTVTISDSKKAFRLTDRDDVNTNGREFGAPLLLWAAPNVDLFWDVAQRERVKSPRLYLKLSEQPEIDAVTGYPVIQGAVCPF